MMIKKILIGVDNSKYAENATKYGFNLAESLNAHVGLVHIVELSAVPIMDNGANEILGTPMQGLSSGDWDILNAQIQVSENILAQSATRHHSNFPVTKFNQSGSTGEGIIECALTFKADLIIVGTHERSGFDRLLSSDIAEYVVRHSPMPVLVVPGKQ